MQDIGIVFGDGEQARELVIGKDKVYVHTDITPVADGEDLFQYHEVQYDKDEYIEILAKQNAELSDSLTDTQLALCEIYEAGN